MKKRLNKITGVVMSMIMAFSGVLMSAGHSTNEVKAATEPDLALGEKLTRERRVAVHDPSIVYGENGNYYIFGSHMSWATSQDLTNWGTVTTNINSQFATIFAKPATWARRGSATYVLRDNLWAPDVIYNKKMGKWCMYMSVNGANHSSVISLATADKITGPYTYVGDIVYSGFSYAANRSYTLTDYQKATGDTNINRFLANGVWNPLYGTNAIDPCVRYDENGDLWMAYGSWFGGIYMLKLDENTGLRDYTHTYKTVTNKSDAYMGIRVAGGYGLSGEGCYITYDKEAGYYYMYLSYCGLDATDGFSGYHLRMYRAKEITGPYTDAAGNPAVYTSANDNQRGHGVKLFGNYAFSSMKGNGQNSENGYMSGGHNSAYIDNDGNHFLIYHTRFNNGTEWHEVRTHQQFVNEDGWLVTAPYEYRGSKISETGYAESEIVGSYEIINHGLAAATEYTGMLTNQKAMLLADGTICGDVTGTWKAKDNSYYVTMVIDGVEYKGVFFKQYDESAAHNEVMTFTLIGENNTSVWGSKIADTAEMAKVALDSVLGGKISTNVEVPQFSNIKISVTEDSEYLAVSEDGTKVLYTAPEADTEAVLTATMDVKGMTHTYTINTIVESYKGSEVNEKVSALYDFEDTNLVKDATGNNNTLTNYGVTTYNDSKRGKVAYFDGATHYMQLPAAVTESDDFTFMAWVNSKTAAGWERVFDFGDSEGNSLFFTSHGYGEKECVRAAFAVGGTEVKADGTEMLANNQWVHVAVTIDSAKETMSLYINGSLVNTAKLTNTTKEAFSGARNYLGKSQYAPDAYFKGYMDDVAISAEALSQADIQAFMANGGNGADITIDKDSSAISVIPGTYVKITEDGKEASAALACTSSDQTIAKVCANGVIRTMESGLASVEVTLADGSKKTVLINVEDEAGVTYGDVNQDGKMDIFDMELIQKHVLSISELEGDALKAASLTTFDGQVSVLDLEAVQNHVLGLKEILQIER